MRRLGALGMAIWTALTWSCVSAAPPSNRVVVEEAYIVPDAASPGYATVYVVINNRTTTEVTLTGVSSPGARESVLRNGRGTPVADGRITIPIHSELYMTPGGIHVAMAGVTIPPGDRFPLLLTLDGSMRATFNARVLSAEAPVPDHHDYVHRDD